MLNKTGYISYQTEPLFFVVALFLILIFPFELLSQNSQDKKEIRAYRLQDSDEFIFDGKVTEDFWDRVPPATNFRQQEPSEGALATEKTEVRIAYDDEYLYMSAILFDSDPSGIKATQKRRDVRIVADERFTWFFDTFNDQRSAYFMEVNPNALRTDGLITTGQGRSISLNWDGIWDAKAEINEQGWSTEIKIPFRTFNFNPESDTWGVNFMRVIRRKSETALWTGYMRNQGIERPQDGGVLTGLTGMSQGLGLEVVPFGILTGSEQNLAEGDETDTELDGGLDINYSITPSLKASLTFNTDFAEAEVDQRIVNLTRFAVQFPEQRDFFLEGSNIYEFAPASRVNPYFSRRIGLNDGQPIPITMELAYWEIPDSTISHSCMYEPVNLARLTRRIFPLPGSNETSVAKAHWVWFIHAELQKEMLIRIFNCRIATQSDRILNWGHPRLWVTRTCNSRPFLSIITPRLKKADPIFGIDHPAGFG